MNAHYPAVARRAGHRCEYCHAPEVIFNLSFEVEHIVPVSEGGGDDESNLALSCRSCNLFKGASLTGLNGASETAFRLFHPRQDRWIEHFDLDTETGSIRALTPVARGTVMRLHMNSPVQVTARRQWIALGLFPV